MPHPWARCSIYILPTRHQRGLQVLVGLSETVATELLKQGQAVPTPIAGYALIDTGASTTCIDDAIAQQRGLPVVDTMMASASHTAIQQNVYPARTEVVSTQIVISAERAMGAALQAQGLVALIGRDVLRDFTLHYNGPTGMFTPSV